MPYSSWILPASWSRLPAITSSWSSVSLPHCCFALPLSCFQLPSIRSQFICLAPYEIERSAGATLRQPDSLSANCVPPVFVENVQGLERAQQRCHVAGLREKRGISRTYLQGDSNLGKYGIA